MSEKDPSGLDAHAPGAKLDAGKVDFALLEDFSLAMTEVMKVATGGAEKYSRGGWLLVPEGIRRYTAAMMRHIFKHWAGEKYDRDSGLLHAAHTAWNGLARLELILREQQKQTNQLELDKMDGKVDNTNFS